MATGRRRALESVTKLTSEQWAAVGIGATAAVAAATWLGSYFGRRFERSRQATPDLRFSAIYLFEAGEHPRGGYEFALGFRMKNLGPGYAAPVLVRFQGTELKSDGERVLCSEGITNRGLVPGDETEDFLGIRWDPKSSEEPSMEEVRSFLEEGILLAVCWDSLDRVYEFTPVGGRRVPRSESKHFSKPQQMAKRLFEEFPSRGDRPSSFGGGTGN